MMHSTIIRRGDAAAAVGACERWVEVSTAYEPRSEVGFTVQESDTRQSYVPAGAPVAQYLWASMPSGIEGARENADLPVPHFCCHDGVELAHQLADRWQSIGLIKESTLTGIYAAARAGGSAALAASFASACCVGTTGGIYGAATGFSASFAKGALCAIKKSLLVGAAGAGKGALKGAMWGGNVVVGSLLGLAAGTGMGMAQYASLRQVKNHDDLLIKVIDVFSEFTSGELDYREAVRRLAVQVYQYEQLVPDAAQRQALPVFRACQEVQYVLDEYAEKQGWT